MISTQPSTQTEHRPASSGPAVSVLVPVTPDPDPLERIYAEYSAPFRHAGLAYEFVFILNGPYPGLVAPLEALRAKGEPVRVLVSMHAPPEAAVAHVGAVHTTSPILVTLPSYPRLVPDALLELVRALDGGFDLVTGARINRNDPLVNRIQRRTFHFLLRRMVGGSFRDIACGVRAMRREMLEELDLYGDSFRFVPMLALRDGFRVLEMPARAHPDDRRNRVYAPGVYLRRLVDLVGLMFLVRFTYKPLRFFGLLGSGLAGSGGVILAVLFVQRLGGRGIADRPLLLLGVLLVVLGLQALALGLIGEIVVHHNVSKRPLYRLLDVDPRAGEERTLASTQPDVSGDAPGAGSGGLGQQGGGGSLDT